MQHRNAPLTPLGRRRLVALVEQGRELRKNERTHHRALVTQPGADLGGARDRLGLDPSIPLVQLRDRQLGSRPLP
jgi:hypothetical protein